MIESLKRMEVLEALKDNRSDCNFYRDLITQLFLDFPNLKTVAVSKTQQYNDNDYSDYFHVANINELAIEDGEHYLDCEEVAKANKDLVFGDVELNHIIGVLNSTQDYFGNNYEDDVQNINREDYVDEEEEGLKKRKARSLVRNSKPFDAYYYAIENNEKIKNLSVFRNHANWALYYCMDMNEKLPDDLVEKIFKNDIKYAYFYAENVLKDRLPNKIEKYFDKVEKELALKSFENKETSYSEKHEDNNNRYYISKYREFVKNLCIAN